MEGGGLCCKHREKQEVQEDEGEESEHTMLEMSNNNRSVQPRGGCSAALGTEVPL